MTLRGTDGRDPLTTTNVGGAITSETTTSRRPWIDDCDDEDKGGIAVDRDIRPSGDDDGNVAGDCDGGGDEDGDNDGRRQQL